MQFDIPEIKIERNDSRDLRQRILNMSPEERKILGINKSALWYEKNKLNEGKKIKLYDKVMYKIR